MFSSNTNSEPARQMPQRARSALLLLLWLMLAPWCGIAAGVENGTAIAVIYPDIAEPFRSVFTKIIEGIEQRAKVRSYAIGANSNAAELNTVLKFSGTKVVIALGRQGVKTAASLDKDMDVVVVVSGVLAVPEMAGRNLLGISLTPDPALLFALLKKLMPHIKRVAVIANPQNSAWLLQMAREAARTQGLELLIHEARDLASAARLYETTLRNAEGQADAIWLPHDPSTVDEDTILPLILKESWNHAVPVFSSSFPHVKKGVLFALYPNNLELGHDLAGVALGALADPNGKQGVRPLRQVYTALNLRTASHLGLNISPQQLRNFDFVFPEP